MEVGVPISAWPLACPVCERELVSSGAVLRCAQGHSFDVAREGYVNLLTAKHRVAGLEGDVSPMLCARRRFLEAGHFEPLRQALVQLAGRALAEAGAAEKPAAVLEVGCGEGYYIGSLARELRGDIEGVRVFLGTDLSKSAAKLAARRYPGARFFIADVHRRLYVRDASIRVLLDVFAPRNPAEFARVVELGGALIVAIPAPDHLASLRERFGLLGLEEEKERRVAERFAGDFSLAERQELRFELRLSADEVRDVVEMGPNHWHHRLDQMVISDDELVTEASLVVMYLEREQVRV
ncbi:MAG: putative RNA methyltransferase [Coriobacteriia bacterium]